MADEKTILQTIEKVIRKSRLDQSALLVLPGDDAALLRSIKFPVISTDTQRENVHFKTDWQTFYEIGKKAVTATLSDLAASYAKPVALFINLGLPETISKEMIHDLYCGICDTLSEYGCALGGGNIANAPTLGLDLFALGSGNGFMPIRSAAKPGESLYLTSAPGAARAGLDALQKKCDDYPRLIDAFKHPTARFFEAGILHNFGVQCVMDLSDGLFEDARKLASAANISIKLSLNEEHLLPEMRHYCKKFNLPLVDMALAGGEEYELLFTCDPGHFQNIKKRLPGALKVGDCLEFQGNHLLNSPTAYHSFTHNSRR